jgi:hypothetical protein
LCEGRGSHPARSAAALTTAMSRRCADQNFCVAPRINGAPDHQILDRLRHLAFKAYGS